MNFNTILLRFGLDPDDFINELIEPIKSGNVFIYNIRQKTDFRHCPYCNHDDAYINDYDYVEINESDNEIGNCLAKNQTSKVYSNGIAEAINNELKTITKNAYGYHCFDRLRRRALIIQSSKKRT